MLDEPEIINSRTFSLNEFSASAHHLTSQLEFCWKNGLYLRMTTYTSDEGAPMVRLDLAKSPFVTPGDVEAADVG